MPASFYLDSNIFMYAAGKEHLLKKPCVSIIDAVAEGDLVGFASAEVFQEILYRYFALDKRVEGIELCLQGLLVCEVLPVASEDIKRTISLCRAYSFLNSRDALHAAIMINHGISTIISADKDFDQLGEIKRVDPSEFEKWL